MNEFNWKINIHGRFSLRKPNRKPSGSHYWFNWNNAAFKTSRKFMSFCVRVFLSTWRLLKGPHTRFVLKHCKLGKAIISYVCWTKAKAKVLDCNLLVCYSIRITKTFKRSYTMCICYTHFTNLGLTPII